MNPRPILCFVLLLMSLCSTFAGAAFAGEVMVRPAELERDIAFWRRIYTEVGTSGGLVHDPDRLDVVYEVLDFPKDLPARERAKRIESTKQKYARILRELASGSADTAEARRVRDLWPANTSRSRFEQAAENVRFQLGQSDRFREGLIRSGAWKPRIEEMFAKAGLPRELAVLPHVESSFNTYAYSKVGAAGMWQFMRSTGRRFLRIDATVDERLDPYRATEAAVKFLEQNYAVLGTWPLALTAYNHGPAGVRRATEQLGTTDIAVIARKYQSPSFGFASRNFYVAYLAALEIDQNPEKFFGNIQRDPLDDSVIIDVPGSVSVRTLAKLSGTSTDELRRINPSLLPSVWNGTRSVPRGFNFRLPSRVDRNTVLARLGGAASNRDVLLADTGPTTLAMEGQHKVRKGETLSAIATRYGLGFSQLAKYNGLKHPYRLHVGQVLKVPGSEPAAVVARNEPPPAVTPTETIKRYRVKRGDTLSKIAKRNHVTEEQLIEFNGLRSANFIYEGQVLALEATAEPIETVAQVPVESVPTVTTDAPLATNAEPVTESEAENLGPTLVPGAQAANDADPADYSVHENGTIQVQAAETIGHYAEWLDVTASRLRKLNRMSAATPVVIGRKLKLDFSKVSRSEFEATRRTFHKQVQDVFFTQFRIADTETHVVQKGDSVWELAERRYNVPVWLLRQYNPDVDMSDVRPGTKLTIPRITPIGADATPTATR